MVKSYTDEDVSSWLVQLLRDRNARYDVVTTKNLTNLGDSDADQLLTATQQHRVLVTHNFSSHTMRTTSSCSTWRGIAGRVSGTYSRCPVTPVSLPSPNDDNTRMSN